MIWDRYPMAAGRWGEDVGEEQAGRASLHLHVDISDDSALLPTCKTRM